MRSGRSDSGDLHTLRAAHRLLFYYGRAPNRRRAYIAHALVEVPKRAAVYQHILSRHGARVSLFTAADGRGGGASHHLAKPIVGGAHWMEIPRRHIAGANTLGIGLRDRVDCFNIRATNARR